MKKTLQNIIIAGSSALAGALGYSAYEHYSEKEPRAVQSVAYESESKAEKKVLETEVSEDYVPTLEDFKKVLGKRIIDQKKVEEVYKIDTSDKIKPGENIKKVYKIYSQTEKEININTKDYNFDLMKKINDEDLLRYESILGIKLNKEDKADRMFMVYYKWFQSPLTY